jgi:hypothetical protein
MIDLSLWQNLVITAILGIAALLVVLKITKLIKRALRQKELYGLDKKEIKKRWQEIEGLLDRKNEMNYKLAVLEADKLLDHVLKYMGFGGSSFGERLKLASYKFPKLHQVWPAHKIRNRLVHEASYQLGFGETRRVIKIFRKGLVELGVL